MACFGTYTRDVCESCRAMNPGFLKTLLAAIPVSMLLVGSIFTFIQRKNVISFLQLFGAACLTMVLVTHFFEQFQLFTWMQWGQEHSAGHYVDLYCAVLGLAFFPTGYLLQAVLAFEDRPYNRNMIREKVQKEIDDAQKFGEQLEATVVDKKQFPIDERNVLLMAYWALIFDYHKGILSLLHAQFYGAAFALVRPVVEAVVRAHVALKGSVEDVRRIQSDEYSVKFTQIGAKIDADFDLDHLMENFLNDVTRSALHSYTHSGLLQLGRRFDGNDIKPNYGDDEIVQVVRVTTSAAFMVTNLVTKHFGFEEDWKRVGRMFNEWGKH